MFRVLVAFDDLQDEKKRYEKGDVYPREGLKPSKKRIKELSTKENRRKTILIAEVIEDESTVKTPTTD